MLGSKNQPRAPRRERSRPSPSASLPEVRAAIPEIVRAPALDMSRVRRAFDALRPVPGAAGDAPVGIRSEREAGLASLRFRSDAATAADAAVAAVLRDGAGGPEVLLIQRADNPRDPWSGHMALPGGRRDRSDVDLFETAVREAREEIGLDLRRGAVLVGSLGSARTLSPGRAHDVCVYPLVFALDTSQEPQPDPREVQRVLWARLEHLISPAAASSFEHHERGRRYRFPAFDVDGHLVWGLTHRVLSELLAIVEPGWPGVVSRRNAHDGSTGL